jgi:hypothetical protein
MFDFKLAESAALTPYMIHFNWLNGFDAKLQQLKSNGMWLVEGDGGGGPKRLL